MKFAVLISAEILLAAGYAVATAEGSIRWSSGLAESASLARRASDPTRPAAKTQTPQDHT